jgi:hypothetical protein
MNVLADGQATHMEPDDVLTQRKGSFRSWLFSYEIYIIIIVAAFLRLYGIHTTEFDGDQADFFYMARDAVVHGHLVATSTTASIGVYNPPIFIYLLMIPAAISGNNLLVYASLLWACGCNNCSFAFCWHFSVDFLFALHMESKHIIGFCTTFYDRTFSWCCRS